MKQYFEKIDQKQLRLLLGVLMVLILFCSYQFGFLKYNNKTEAIEEASVALQQRYNDLNNQVAQEPIWKESIASYQTEMQTIMDQYGPGNTPEKSTKFLIDLGAATGITIPTVSFSQEQPIFSSTTLPSADGLGVYAYQSTISITYLASYEGLKDCMDYIHQYPEKMDVENITASFDSETGDLSGTLDINLYSMTGTGKTYVPPVIDGVNIGTQSIFGTYEEP